MEWWNTGIMSRYPLEGRALSRPATTKRGPPEAIFPIIPTFPYSNIPVEVIDKPAARGTGNRPTGNFFINELNELNELRVG